VKSRDFVFALAAWMLVFPAAPSRAETGLEWIDENDSITFNADLRLRYELDWDSEQSDGSEREDRNRGRLRARFGATFDFSEEWSVGARIRTGSRRSQQSPHLTFASDEGGRDDLDFVADRYFIQFKRKEVSGWAGRNTFPFQQQSELFWSPDVTPTGLAGALETRIGAGLLRHAIGAFYLPDGGNRLNGQIVAGQIQYSLAAAGSDWSSSASLYFMNGENGANDLRNRNGERDYLIGTLGLRWARRFDTLPVRVDADVFYNFEDYDASDVAPFSASDTKEILGYAFTLRVGQLEERSDWLAGYTYAHIETFAVNASYAQDDWIRFGSGAQTDSSDFEGHEIRVGYSLSKNIQLLARVYLVEAITTSQDGNRFRLDLNWRH
jgi:hypothetical protein